MMVRIFHNKIEPVASNRFLRTPALLFTIASCSFRARSSSTLKKIWVLTVFNTLKQLVDYFKRKISRIENSKGCAGCSMKTYRQETRLFCWHPDEEPCWII
jgi:hypothetical protein